MISLRSQITRKVLDYFFVNQDVEKYINELAKILETDPKNLYLKLRALEKEGILQSRFRGKERYFFLNKKFPSLKEYRKIFLRTFGFERIVREALLKIKGIKDAYIFGSYAKDTMDVSSDIDLLVVGTHSILEFQRAMDKIQRHSNREINAVNVGPGEFKRQIAQRGSFVGKIISGKHIKIL